MLSNHLILCLPLLLLPSMFPSIRVFSSESALCIRWPKYWRFSFSISPSNEYSGLISLRLDLLAVQGTVKSLLQHHSSKASILQLVPHKTAGRTGGETEEEVQVIPAASSAHSVAVTLSHPQTQCFFQGSPLSFPSPKPSFFCLQIRAISRVKAIKNSQKSTSDNEQVNLAFLPNLLLETRYLGKCKSRGSISAMAACVCVCVCVCVYVGGEGWGGQKKS